MYWIPPSNQQINSNTNPFRALTPQQLRQQYHQRLAEGREGIPQDELQSLFKTLKKGDVLRLQYKSAMTSTQGDGIEVIASNPRSLLGGSVEKITLKQKKNPSGVKYFLYKRGNNVSFAVGDMGAVITSVLKESNELDEAINTDLEDRDDIMGIIKGAKYSRAIQKFITPDEKSLAALKNMITLMYGNRADLNKAKEIDSGYDFVSAIMYEIDRGNLPKFPQSFFLRIGGPELSSDAAKMKIAYEQYQIDEAEGGLSSSDTKKLLDKKTNAFPANKSMNSSQMFDWIVRYGVKLGDWVGQSFFYYDGNVWMLKNGTVSNNGSIRDFRRKVNKGVADSLEPALSDVEKLAAKGTIEEAKAPANLMKEFDKMINNYQDSQLAGADSFDKKTILDDVKELRKVFDLVRKGQIDKAWDAYENLDSELQINVVPDRIVQFMDMNLSEEKAQTLDEAWTADSVKRNADIGSDKGYGINIKKGKGVTKTPYKHMLMMRSTGNKIKVRFDFGKDHFVGTAQEVADHINKILGLAATPEMNPGLTARNPFRLRDGLRKEHSLDEMSAKDHYKKVMRGGKGKGFEVVSPIDREKYPNREKQGLEGPFRSKKSGKVFYYDKKEGKYYDPDSDMFLDVDDVMESTLVENRRPEQMIKAFYKMHPKLKLNGVSEDELKKLAVKAMKEGGGWGSKSFLLLATFLQKAGATGMFSESLDESAVAKKKEKFKAGIPKWFSTVFTGMPKYPTQAIAGWKTELETGSGMPGYITYVLHYDGLGTYTVYQGDGYPKVKIRGNKPLGKFRSPEEAMDFVQKTVVNENLDEALRGILDVKPNSKEWMTGEITNKKSVEHGRGVSTTFNIGDHISIHPFDGDRYVGAVDRSDPKTYFFVAKYTVKPVKPSRYEETQLEEGVDMENLEEMKFSNAQLDMLRAEYGKINKIDPASPAYKKLIDFLNSLPKETIKQLVGAKPPIKFLSKLAFNRFNRMQNPRKYPSDKLGENVTEEELTKAQMDKREEIVKSMKKKTAEFEKRYGDKAKEVMYATATKMAKEEYTWDEKRGAYVRTDGEEGPLEVPVLIDKGNQVADEVPHVNKYANSGESKMRRGVSEGVEPVMARELLLFISNDADTYSRRIKPIIKNLARKIRKGDFDQTLAIKGFLYAVEHGIKNYSKEYGDIGRVDKATKNEVASQLLDQFMDEINDEV